MAGFLEYFRRRVQCLRLFSAYPFVLFGGFYRAVALENKVNGFHGYVGTELHQAVIDVFCIGVFGDGEALLKDNAPRVDVLVEEECGDSRFGFAVDDGPVDGGRTAILRQQCGVDVERAHTWHAPDYFGKHAEGHHNLQVGLIGSQLLCEVGVFHFYGLKHGNIVLQCISFHRRGLQIVLMTSDGLVGLGHHGHHIVSAFNQSFQCAYGKLGGSHEYDSQVFLFHIPYYIIGYKVTKKFQESPFAVFL